jgi:creatinine amidohydrolase
MNLTDLPWPRIAGLAPDTPLVFPVAAVEQHGPHLPVGTDSMILAEVVRRVQALVGAGVLFAPLQWLGNSDHHLNFAGTLSAEPRGYLDSLNRLMDNALRHGFRRIVFLNGHGGNEIPGRQAVFETRQRYAQRQDLLLLFTSYWDHAKPRTACEDLVQHSVGHACEWETSMMQVIHPQLVGPSAGLPDVPRNFGFEPAYRGWITDDRTSAGHMGAPRHATPEKGEHLLQSFAQGVTAFLQKVIDWDGRSWLAAEEAPRGRAATKQESA